jgi:hypothetical protein
MSRLFEPEAISQAAKRHPAMMSLGDSNRRYMAGMVAFAFVVLCLGLVEAEFSIARMIAGATRLGDFAVLMMPPDPGKNLQLYVVAMIDTLGIALLGTVIAAVFAFPLAILASRNVLPIWFVRFFLRRSFDTVRGVETLIWALSGSVRSAWVPSRACSPWPPQILAPLASCFLKLLRPQTKDLLRAFAQQGGQLRRSFAMASCRRCCQ